MRLLLDTHTFLWFLLDDPQLSPTARDFIINPANDIEVSPVTYWEIAIKISLGKYELPEPYDISDIEQVVLKSLNQLYFIFSKNT